MKTKLKDKDKKKNLCLNNMHLLALLTLLQLFRRSQDPLSRSKIPYAFDLNGEVEAGLPVGQIPLDSESEKVEKVPWL